MKNKVLKAVLIVSVLSINIQFGISQTEDDLAPLVDDVTPPSPESANLGKYGEVPVSLNTGTPNISIPIYEIKGNEVSLPITIDYHASGFKVEEVPSWVGLGWTLNAGGVITRYVRGRPDDKAYGYFSQYDYWKDNIYPLDKTEVTPSDPGCSYRLDAAQGLKDLEPDIFYYNFSGYSGKIIFTKDKTPILFPHQDFKVSVTSDFSRWTITTPDGIQYVFEDNEITTSRLGMSYYSSWYLSRIWERNCTDYIDFNYSNSGGSEEGRFMEYPSSKTIDLIYNGGMPSCPDAYTSNPSIDVAVTNPTYYLASIDYGSLNIKVEFVAKNDREDIGGDNTAYRLDSIYVKRKSDNMFIKKYNLANASYFVGNSNGIGGLTYLNKRLRLDTLKEVLSGSVHVFEYNDLGMPSYKSADIDHWGYYNYDGTNHNEGLIPDLETSESLYYNAANNPDPANRETDTTAVKACLLEKIVYPTGGSTTFEYSAHYWSDDTVQDYTSEYLQVHSEGGESFEMDNYETQIRNFYINGDFELPNGPPNVDINYFFLYEPTKVKIHTTKTPGSPLGHFSVWLNKNGCAEMPEESTQGIIWPDGCGYEVFDVAESDPGKISSYDRIIDLETGLYFVYALVSEDLTSYSITTTIEFVKQEAVASPSCYIGGVRVRKISNHDGIDENNNIEKKYYYLDDLGESSLKYFQEPTWGPYPKPNYSYYPYCGLNLIKTAHHVDDWGQQVYTEGSHIGYSTVRVESEGKENGSVIYKYANDNNPLFRSQLLEEKYLDKNDSLVKLVNYEYNNDSYYFSNSNIYRAQIRIKGVTQDANIYYTFDERYSSRTSQWIGLSKKTVKEYDSDFGSYIETITEYEYEGAENGKHTNVSEKSFTDSHGNIIKINYTYPPDYVYYLGPDTSMVVALNGMRAKNMVNYPIEIIKTINDKIIEGTLNIYRNDGVITNPMLYEIYVLETDQPLNEGTGVDNFTSSYIEPGQSQTGVFTKDNHYGTCQTKIYRRNAHNKITQIKEEDGIINSIVYDYGDIFPVAIVRNTLENDIAYCSFETNELNGWHIADTNYHENVAITGNRSIKGNIISATINKPTIITYWAKGGVPTNNRSIDYEEIDSNDDGWKLYRLDEISSDSITLYNNNAFIDEIRLYPSDAQMTTYYYDQHKGITSVCDENNLITYYEYDEAGRLICIRDNNRKKLKEFEYHYKNP